MRFLPSYAHSRLLPNSPSRNDKVALTVVMTRSGSTSKRGTERLGFSSCTSGPSRVLAPVVEASVRRATRNNGLIQFPDRSYVTVQDLHVTQSASVGICPASSGRYVRILGVQRATPFRYSLYEFEIYS